MDLCPYAEECGACPLIRMPYHQQLERKERHVRELFEALSDPRTEFHPIMGMEQPWHYRNKVISPFVWAPSARKGNARDGREEDGKRGKPARRGSRGCRKGEGRSQDRARFTSTPILTGMYRAGTHDVIRTDGCYVENEVANEIVVAIRDLMPRFRLEPYDEDTGEGFLRHAVIRVGHASGEVLVTLVTNAEQFPGAKAFCRELKAHCPQITSIVQNVNLRDTNVVLGDGKERTLYGPGFILDTLCGLSFRISSRSFYQVNGVQTQRLYERAIDLARLTGTETVLDAYCGTGTIGLVAAKRLQQLREARETAGNGEPADPSAVGEPVGEARETPDLVLGVDDVRQAIRDAQNNARHNGVGNARFTAMDAGAYLRGLADDGVAVDVLFMDPPRSGASEEFLEAVARLAPRRIVYISCNPRTQQRDVRLLDAAGWRITDVQAVDMFPHTDHIESIVALERP